MFNVCLIITSPTLSLSEYDRIMQLPHRQALNTTAILYYNHKEPSQVSVSPATIQCAPHASMYWLGSSVHLS